MALGSNCWELHETLPSRRSEHSIVQRKADVGQTWACKGLVWQDMRRRPDKVDVICLRSLFHARLFKRLLRGFLQSTDVATEDFTFLLVTDPFESLPKTGEAPTWSS
jgi:hypothetical protein